MWNKKVYLIEKVQRNFINRLDFKMKEIFPISKSFELKKNIFVWNLKQIDKVFKQKRPWTGLNPV